MSARRPGARCRRSLDALEHDDRDLALGSRRVLVVVRPDLVRLRPEALALGSPSAVRARARKTSSFTCSSTSGVFDEVAVPARDPRARLPATRRSRTGRRPRRRSAASYAARRSSGRSSSAAGSSSPPSRCAPPHHRSRGIDRRAPGRTASPHAHSNAPSTSNRVDGSRERVSCHSPSCHSTASPTLSSTDSSCVDATTRPQVPRAAAAMRRRARRSRRRAGPPIRARRRGRRAYAEAFRVEVLDQPRRQLADDPHATISAAAPTMREKRGTVPSRSTCAQNSMSASRPEARTCARSGPRAAPASCGRGPRPRSRRRCARRRARRRSGRRSTRRRARTSP